MKGNKFLIKLDESKYDGNIQVSESGVEQVATKMYEQVAEGQAKAIDMIEMFKFVGEVETKLKKMTDANGKNSFVDFVRDEIKTNSDDGKSCSSKYGTKLELAETGTKYNFQLCGDPEWNELNKQSEALDKKIKKRETFLKTIDEKGIIITDKDTGETIELSAPIKTSTSSFKQTLLKD